MRKMPAYATRKELDAHKKEVIRLVKEATRKIKKWDVKQDKDLLKKAER